LYIKIFRFKLLRSLIRNKFTEMKLKYHHTGIIVNSILEICENYKQLFGPNCISKIFHISSQNVKVCFVDTGNNSFLELVEPLTEDSGLFRMKKKGISYYHMAYLTENIDQTVSDLVVLNYKPLEFFNSEAFNGKRCIFLFSPDAHLIELIEQ